MGFPIQYTTHSLQDFKKMSLVWFRSFQKVRTALRLKKREQDDKDIY